jgi:hypothetical protein
VPLTETPEEAREGQIPDSPHPPEPGPQGDPQGNGSGDERATLLATLRGKREAAKADHYLDLDIPGYDGLLVARFRPFPIEKTERKMAEFQRNIGKQPVLLKAACDTLIDACEQVMVKKPDWEEPRPLDDEAIPPIAFDERLAQMLGYETSSARQVITGLFPTEQAVLSMNNKVTSWMQDVTQDVDASLLGE